MKNIVIPMLVEAYASGNITPEQLDIPVMSPNYKNALAISVLGSKNTPGVEKKQKPLEAGVHLHFILPDAFTHSDDGTDYIAVPNRYIVTRIWKENNTGKLKSKCNVVESDFISIEKKYNTSITIPCFTDKNDRRKWRYLGRSYSADDMPNETADYLDKLTAVGPGDPLFAAYYPNCRSVFGFYDDLSDLPKEDSIKLTYFVLGYFSDEKMDPFSQVKNMEDFQAVLDKLQFSVEEQSEPCNHSFFYGAIDSIEWKGLNGYYANIPKGNVDAVFANNSAEALSKLLHNNLDQNSHISEREITALQYELYDQMNKPDGNYTIDDAIHNNKFARKGSMDEVLNVAVDKNVTLSKEEGLGKELSSIKETGAHIGDLKRLLDYNNLKLYTIWEQYILLYEDEDDEVNELKGYPSRQEYQDEIRKVIDIIKSSQNQIQEEEASYREKVAVINKKFPEGVTCEKGGSESFYSTKDPVLLLSGDGINRTYAFGEDGRFTSNGTLKCQTESVHTNISSTDIITKCFEQIKYLGNLPAIYSEMLVQTSLVSSQVLAELKRMLGAIEVTGTLSSKIALNKNPFDFTTLFMQWGVNYYPTRTDKKSDNTLQKWKFEYGDTDLVYEGGLTTQTDNEYSISGYTILTPHAVNNLCSAIKGYADTYGDIYGEEADLKELADKANKLSIISQNLSGFTEYFSDFKDTLQFPIMGIDEDTTIEDAVKEVLDGEHKSILQYSDLLPLHGGYIKFTDISLVSSFGLTQTLAEKSYFNNADVDFAETVACKEKDYGLLTPSFSDYTRLKVDFIAANDNTMFTTIAPESSPVCGYVIPEVLNKRLIVYTADGDYIGMVKTVYRNENPQARWLSSPMLNSDFDKLNFKSQYLKDFLKTLINGDDAFHEFNGLMNQYLNAKQGSNTLIWGRPMALTRLKMKFEFDGKPQFEKKYEDFPDYNNTANVEKVRFKMGIGDMGRITDGVFGYFEDSNFEEMIPAFGSKNPYGTEHYMKYSHTMDISNADGDRFFTVLIEPDSRINIQTGVLPVKTIQLEAEHTKIMSSLPFSAEISPILSTLPDVMLPSLPQEDTKHPFNWYYLEKENFIENKIVPPINTFDNTILMDGYIVKENKNGA